MIFLILNFANSAICPEGVKYYHNEKFNITIQKNSWHYFYTSLTKNEASPNLILSAKSDFPINFYIEELPNCPDGSKPPFFESPGGLRFIRGSTFYKSRHSMIAVGIFSKETGHVSISLEGQHIVKETKHPAMKLFLILFLMIGFTAFCFCNVILPHDMKKDKIKEE